MGNQLVDCLGRRNRHPGRRVPAVELAPAEDPPPGDAQTACQPDLDRPLEGTLSRSGLVEQPSASELLDHQPQLAELLAHQPQLAELLANQPSPAELLLRS